MKIKILGTSDTWMTRLLSHQPSKPAYYIVDCCISVALRRQNAGRKVIKLQLCATYCKYACSLYLESLSSWKCQPNFSGDTSFLKIAKSKIVLSNLTFVGRGA